MSGDSAKDRVPARQSRHAYDEVVTVDKHGGARSILARSPGRIVLVDRGEPRTVLFHCPCGCGETVVINVDRRAGPAWRLRVNEHGLTLMPSVWRTSGCRSHFILCKSRVWWCRFDNDLDGSGSTSDYEDDWPADMDADLCEVWRRIHLEQKRGRARL